ncbi:MAG: chemotaxis protein CheW [Candidatus Edwardsbacteria bacterium]|nr:chemotaxis protein CheW [Candidatus Edwardsbacteria bacterium]MBU1577100.1 chemotaxis protein CheW [Candidatus Edwardsbacteria bacterium]MBU2463563.1 chemotaxis protein CheW [Candidatus Edwardsbacteria bacterium]MBU2594032.1 chemotaxis protein CheW [Candidatus Edwardsbacteria bacterium]
MAEKIASQEIVIFNLGKEKFALFTDQVKSIEEMQDIVPVPMAPDYLSGLINLRGEITTIIDLRRRLHLKNSQIGPDVVIIIVDYNQETAGLIVDRVDSVETIKAVPKDVPDNIRKAANGRFYDKVIEINREKIIILNLDKILSLEESK